MRTRDLAACLLAASFATVAGAQINPLATKGLTAIALGTPANWITPADYPASLNALPDKSTTVWLSVGSKGLVSGCEVTYSSGMPDLDALTCRLLTERGRFKPGGSYPYGLAVDWTLIGALAPGQGSVRPMRAPVPLTSPETWVTNDDYPRQPSDSAGYAQIRQTAVGYRVDVDISGKVARCTPFSGNDKLSDRFEKATCENIEKRATFDPALDASGHPVAGVYRGTIFWLQDGVCRSDICFPPMDQRYQMAKMPEGWQSVTLAADVLIDADGTTRDCVGRSVAGGMTFPAPGEKRAALGPLAATVCQQVMSSWKAVPGRDAGGNPVASVQNLLLQIRLPVGSLPSPPPPPTLRSVPHRK